MMMNHFHTIKMQTNQKSNMIWIEICQSFANYSSIMLTTIPLKSRKYRPALRWVGRTPTNSLSPHKHSHIQKIKDNWRSRLQISWIREIAHRRLKLLNPSLLTPGGPCSNTLMPLVGGGGRHQDRIEGGSKPSWWDLMDLLPIDGTYINGLRLQLHQIDPITKSRMNPWFRVFM